MKADVPYTWSPCVKTRDRLVVNPEEIGVEGIPVLGVNRARNMSAGAEPHRHRAMEITVCEHGAVKFDADGRAWTLLPGTVFVTQPGARSVDGVQVTQTNHTLGLINGHEMLYPY